MPSVADVTRLDQPPLNGAQAHGVTLPPWKRRIRRILLGPPELGYKPFPAAAVVVGMEGRYCSDGKAERRAASLPVRRRRLPDRAPRPSRGARSGRTRSTTPGRFQKASTRTGRTPKGRRSANSGRSSATGTRGPRIDLGTVRQASGKYVRAWAVRAEHLATEAVVSNRFEMEWPPKSGTMEGVPEVDRAQWMTVVEASTRLVAAQAELLGRLAAALGTELPVD